MNHLAFKHELAVAVSVLALFLASGARAQDFTVNSLVGQQVMTNPGDVGIVEAGGRISTSNDFENAVEMLNTAQSVTNQSGGTIDTLGNGAFGIFSNGDGALINNEGLIATAGDGSDGISSFGLNASIANSGMITTAGSQVVGIFTGAAGADIFNTGLIASTGPQEAYGIASIGNGSSIRNEGSIEAGDALLGGLASIGILSSGTGSAVYNTGNVRAWGTASTGILSDGDQAAIRNGGLVAVDGTAAIAILSAGEDAVIRNSGRIESTGLVSVGVVSAGNGATFVNSGTVTADLAEFAIIMAGNDAMLDLRAGTAIQGNIAFAGFDGALNIGNGLNTALTFVSTPTFLDTNGAPFAISGNTLAVVDPTGFTSQDEVLADVTGAIANALDDRLAAARSRARGSFATVDGMMVSPVADPSPDASHAAWIAALGGYRSQDSESHGSDFDNRYGGLMIGVDGLAGTGTRMGVFAGATRGEMETSVSSQSIENDNYFAGAYASFSSDGHFLDLSAAAGLAEFDSRRRVANNLVLGGIEHARADYDGVFLSPAVVLGTEIAMGGGMLTPSIRGRYAALFLDGYRESGSAANLDVDNRQVNVFELRGQLAYAFAPVETASGTLDTSIRLGVDGTFGDGGNVDAILLGQPLSISADDGEGTVRGFAGMRVLYTASSGLAIGLSGEMGIDGDSAITADSRLEVSVPF